MSRYRLVPMGAQERVLRQHCRHARLVGPGGGAAFVVEVKGRRSAPGYLEQCRQLKQARAGRVEKISPAFTSVTCRQCRTRNREARESQAVFRCRACGYCGNADVNAARNIAAGQAVTARGGTDVLVPANREPQLSLLAS